MLVLLVLNVFMSSECIMVTANICKCITGERQKDEVES